jgi:glutamate--cysteine ligase
LMREFEPIAAMLDGAFGSSDYGDALRGARALLEQPQLLPSARVLAVMEKDHGKSFVAFTRAQSQQTKAKLLALPFPAGLEAKFSALSEQSMREQHAIEAADTLPFEGWRQQYTAPERLGMSKAAIAPTLVSV